MTLVYEDNQRNDAPNVILYTASNLFKNMLTRDKNSSPLIYMRGIKPKFVVSIVDFIYQDNLDDFLLTAAELKLKWHLVVSSEIKKYFIFKTNYEHPPPKITKQKNNQKKPRVQ